MAVNEFKLQQQHSCGRDQHFFGLHKLLAPMDGIRRGDRGQVFQQEPLNVAGMGYASYLVWKEGGGSLPLTLYGIQLVMNLAWSPLFFKKHEIGFALLDITGILLHDTPHLSETHAKLACVFGRET